MVERVEGVLMIQVKGGNKVYPAGWFHIAALMGGVLCSANHLVPALTGGASGAGSFVNAQYAYPLQGAIAQRRHFRVCL